MIAGKFNANVENLEKQLNCALIVDYEKGCISAWCKAADEQKVYSSIEAKITEIKQQLKNEVKEDIFIVC